LPGVECADVAIVEGEEDFLLHAAEEGQVVVVLDEEPFLEGFEFGGAEGAELGLELAIPIHQGWPGDTDGFGDAAEANAAGAEFEEAVFGFLSMHSSSAVIGYFDSV